MTYFEEYYNVPFPLPKSGRNYSLVLQSSKEGAGKSGAKSNSFKRYLESH